MSKQTKSLLAILIGMMAISPYAANQITVNALHSADGALAVAYGFDGVGAPFTRTAAISGGSATIDLSTVTGPNIDVALQAQYDVAGQDLSQYWWGNNLDEYTTLSTGFSDFSADVLTGEIVTGRQLDFDTDQATFRFQSPPISPATNFDLGELADAFGDVYIPSTASPTLLASSRFSDYVAGQWSVAGGTAYGAVWNQSKSAWTTSGFTLTELARDGDYVHYEVSNGTFIAEYSAFDPTTAPDLLQVAMDLLAFGDQLFYGGATASLVASDLVKITVDLLDDISQDPFIPYYVQGAVFGEHLNGLGGNDHLSQVFDDNVVWSQPAAYIPEPGTVALLGLGGLLVCCLLRRRR